MTTKAIWMEDDALTPDRESLDKAGRRIFGEKVWAWVKEQPVEDQGDAFVQKVTLEIVQSFPGATGIYLRTE